MACAGALTPPTQVAQYYSPSLSALQLFTAPPPEAHGGAAKPQLLIEYNERAPPFARKPLADTLTDLAAAGSCPALSTLSSSKLHARSFVAVCWQPICRIPLGRKFREVSASFVTYHHLCASAADAALPASCSAAVREALSARVAMQPEGMVLLPAFGLLALKLEADQWLLGGEPAFATELAAACAAWMTSRTGRHSDYDFYRASAGAET